MRPTSVELCSTMGWVVACSSVYNSFFPNSLATMPGNYRYIPEEQKKLVLTMLLRGMSAINIERATANWHLQTKCLSDPKHLECQRRGCQPFFREWPAQSFVFPRSICEISPLLQVKCYSNNIYGQYLESLVEQRPDIYTRELKAALFKAYEVEVDGSTITQELHQCGFTRKKVTRRVALLESATKNSDCGIRPISVKLVPT